MNRISGIAASNGIAIAKAFRLENPELTVDKKNVADTQAEIQRFGQAVNESIAELEVIKKRTAEEISDKTAGRALR